MSAAIEHEQGEEYAGPAQISGDDGLDPIDVEVHLRGHFEPLDGRFHWFGRISADPALAERYRSGTTVALSTPHGIAAGKVADLDPWGRFRVTGLGAPPF
ncbi:MAG: DUF4873 domain-containing protein [Marmoricola sp.]